MENSPLSADAAATVQAVRAAPPSGAASFYTAHEGMQLDLEEV